MRGDWSCMVIGLSWIASLSWVAFFLVTGLTRVTRSACESTAMTEISIKRIMKTVLRLQIERNIILYYSITVLYCFIIV